ncbi:MAG: sulfur carrier protein ThiS [Clostridiales bacterium]|nr:sulfur carrier protein ThiS [Clostridiales bacterium]
MIQVNGEHLDGLDGLSVAEFLKARNYPDKMIAVECNGAIVPRGKWAEQTLTDGDHIEVVRFVGGG